MAKKSARRSKAISLYANLAARRRGKLDARARRRAEYLATLPKHPVKRLLYRLHPKRVLKFWFSKQGLITGLKLIGVAFIIMAIFIAALFAYYRRELDAIRPDQLAQRVQSTVTKYYDRNGILLWEDKGDGDYKLVIDAKDIPEVIKQATVALEDRDFYKHSGISITGLARATLNNLFGDGNVQGASTLTQQLIKQVFFAEDAEANRLSVSRKIKEIILAVEVERMYNKDQILALYLNEVPYGGPRNGVESAARAYFGKATKNLTLAEAALIASIPQNPYKFNPYALTSETTKDLIGRQHYALDSMVELGYVTREDADKAKAVPILDTIKPELPATANIKAPHFVLEVRKQLENSENLTTAVVRGGGLSIKTTLDYRIQREAEKAINLNYKHALAIGGNNMAMTAVDVPTGQILAMVGSHNFRDRKVGGQFNAATAPLNPGSSIKPFIYANLMKPKEGLNFGAGTILADDSVQGLVGIKINNYDGRFRGAMTIRQALGQSRNPPAIKAAYIGGLKEAIKTTKEVGDTFYCDGIDYGITAAIGTCAVTVAEHTNAYATLARQGTYKPLAYVLEVKNAQGQVLQQWKDNKAEKALDPQISYILSDILSDDNARSRTFGFGAPGFNVPGVKTATKTGTTDDGEGHPKDGWMMSYTPRLAVGVWTGRSDPRPMHSLGSTANAGVVTAVQTFAHRKIFEKNGSWRTGAWFNRPGGVQSLSVNGRTDLFPSWYVKPANADGTKIVFDKISRRKATDCTPDRARIELTVLSYEDPATKKKTVISPDGYNAKAFDNVHDCSDVEPFVTVSSQPLGGNNYRIIADVSKGTYSLKQLAIYVDGQAVYSQSISNAGQYSVDRTLADGDHTISATVVDHKLYENSDDDTFTVSYWPKRRFGYVW